MNILVTGGPVHAHLDAVKIITNKFRGGRMAEIADMLVAQGLEVTYLTAKGMSEPKRAKVHYHTGYDNYRELVLESAYKYNAMLLGAAGVNLIPSDPWKDKFPSHRYKEGEDIMIPFKIAPRIINQVKKLNPNIHLFGFKLLSGVPHDELIGAAYDVVMDSRADAVFANDATNLDEKFAVTKERSIIPMQTKEMVEFITESMKDEYFQTITTNPPFELDKYIAQAKEILSRYPDRFPVQQGGYVFGSIAVRIPESPGSFLTTSRGKKELEQFTFVAGVDFEQAKVYAGPLKATLNAPLLSRIFTAYKDVTAIVHWHHKSLPVSVNPLVWTPVPILPYAPPGTRRDCQRPIKELGSGFEIEHHGCYELLRPL